MKKNIKYSFLVWGVFLLIGCGGGGKGSNSVASFSTSTKGPEFTSEKQYKINEGSIYVGKIQANDTSKVTYFLKGEDRKFFYIDNYSGDISFFNRPDFESKKTYNIIAVARDTVGNESEQPITITVGDIKEGKKDTTPPVFTSSSSFTINQKTSNEIRIMTSDTSDVTYTLKGAGLDDFDFDTSTGILRVKKLTKSSYTFDIVAKDSAGNIATQTINFQVDKNEPEVISPSQDVEIERDTTKPIFTSSNSITIPLSTQLDYYSASKVLTIQTTDESHVDYYLSGEDSSNFNITNGQLYFTQRAIPLQKSSYSIKVIARDSAGNQNSQNITINIENNVGDTTPPQFLSSNSVSVPLSEQSDYSIAPSVLTIQTDEEAEYYLEGGDYSSFYISERKIWFTQNAIPLQKSSYSFTLVARDSAGNESRQNITISILNYQAPTNTNGSSTATSWTTGAYGENENRTQYLYINGVDALSVHIVGETEQDYDFIKIYDGNTGEIIRSFSGNIDETITVNSFSIYAELVSDVSNNFSGVTVSITETASTPIEPEPTNEYVDISGYWSDEDGTELYHYNEDGTVIDLSKDEENSCYLDVSEFTISYTRLDFNTIKEENLMENFTYDIERNGNSLTYTFEDGNHNTRHQISSNQFYNVKICDQDEEPATPTPQSNKWVTPTQSICENNGGSYGESDGCRANWENAKTICSASGDELPTVETLRAVVTECGGVINDSDNNSNNDSYQTCYKEKGFTSNYYWSATTDVSNSDNAWDVIFGDGGDYLSSKMDEDFIRCVRGGQ